ncbi:MAG: FAD-dependent oxidoreductase, partial [Actinomycetota bacterium]|nr:FAD-dependent oxidoreductase [Actinomycetota bacterium]
VEAMARRAIARGATFHGHTGVTDIEVAAGRIQAVHCRTLAGRTALPEADWNSVPGRLEADVVVSCAGIWGPRIGRMVGLPIPLVPMQHQYVITSPLAELYGTSDEVLHPLLRHQDRDLYFRQHHNRYGVGSYQNRPMPVAADELLAPGEAPVMPSVLAFTPEDFAPAWSDAAELIPALGRTRIDEAINGIFSFTTDGFPLLGESRQVKGFWLAEAVWITHAAGVAKAVAEWMVEGVPSTDLRQCDIQRFEAYALSPAYLAQRASQGYIEVYDIKHPLEPSGEPRPLRVSPFYPRQRELGGVFLEAAGWERTQWFEANAPLLAGVIEGSSDGCVIPARAGWEARFWSPIVGVEHRTTRQRVAMYDMNSLTKVEVTGPGAVTFLQRLTTGNMNRSVGSVTYTLMLDERAGIKSDITVARLADNWFQIGCNGPRDIDWFERHLPTDNSVQVRDITSGVCCIGVWGPLARELVQPLAEADLSENGLKYFRARCTYIQDVPVTIMRISYVGELGWEIYTSADYGLRLWDLLWEAGRPLHAIAAGRGAFDSLRVEKGYRFYGRDMWSEHDPYEAGLGFAVNLKKGEFIGREALLRRKAAGPRRQLVTVTLDDPARVVMGSEPVFSAGVPVGFVTSAAYGYSVGRGVCYAWVPPRCAELGVPLEVEYFGERLAATVAPEPLFDPEMTHLRPPEFAP